MRKSEDDRNKLAREFERVFLGYVLDFFAALPEVESEETEETLDKGPVFEKHFRMYSSANWVVRLCKRDTFVRIVLYQVMMQVGTFFM
jgi:hypothetical protein